MYAGKKKQRNKTTYGHLLLGRTWRRPDRSWRWRTAIVQSRPYCHQHSSTDIQYLNTTLQLPTHAAGSKMGSEGSSFVHANSAGVCSWYWRKNSKSTADTTQNAQKHYFKTIFFWRRDIVLFSTLSLVTGSIAHLFDVRPKSYLWNSWSYSRQILSKGRLCQVLA